MRNPLRTSLVGVLPVAFMLAVASASAQVPGSTAYFQPGTLARYNAAYRSVPMRGGRQMPSITIPLPLGLVQFFNDHPHLEDDPMFNPDSTGFNPVQILNLIFNLPINLELKKPPTPTNDVFIGIGKDSLQVDLGAAKVLIPQDEVGFGGVTRVSDIGWGMKGFRVSVMGWIQEEIKFALGDTLIAFFNGQPAQNNTRYAVTGHGLAAAGLAPTIGYNGRVVGDSMHGLYVGAAVHYYLGAAYGSSSGNGGFTTGDTLFGGPTPVKFDAAALTQYSTLGHTLGHGVGADIGFVYVSGPVEIGFGINDIGATITWPDTRQDSSFYKDSTYSRTTGTGVKTTTKLPVTYAGDVAVTINSTTFGLAVVDGGEGATLRLGGEQRMGPFALRGGLGRDQHKRVQFGGGAGVRMGPVSFDVGVWTHANALSSERSVTMGTSLSIY
ncbi:MAG TPA: hypothetical protein VLV16_11190 [Gemmatimonadales bacterium]|nr:hypothetical protein [Gemmatimonadales bacterium]